MEEAVALDLVVEALLEIQALPIQEEVVVEQTQMHLPAQLLQVEMEVQVL